MNALETWQWWGDEGGMLMRVRRVKNGVVFETCESSGTMESTKAAARLHQAMAALREIASLDFVELRARGYSVGDIALGHARAALSRIGTEA